MPTPINLFTQGAVIEREERRRCIPRGEGLSIVGLILCTQRSPAKTVGRFSVRGPAAWRKDGGTEKNSNTMRTGCKALPYDLWPLCQRHKRPLKCRISGPGLTWQLAFRLSGVCRTRQGCGSGGRGGVFPRGRREAREDRRPARSRRRNASARGRGPGFGLGDRPGRRLLGESASASLHASDVRRENCSGILQSFPARKG